MRSAFRSNSKREICIIPVHGGTILFSALIFLSFLSVPYSLAVETPTTPPTTGPSALIPGAEAKKEATVETVKPQSEKIKSAKGGSHVRPNHHISRQAHHLISTSKQSLATHLESGTSQSRFLYEEAKNLLVSEQPYLIRFEDEDSFGRLNDSKKLSLETRFTSEEVRDYREAVQRIADYRNQVKNRCSGPSSKALSQALDQYFTGLSSFNRRALALAADITENNSQLILIVNRTTLIDAPVLISRYLQFKKQRFKEAIHSFLPGDKELIASMVKIGKTLKVEIIDSDWDRNYALRENALEVISLWPREFIFEATEKLADAKANICVVPASKSAVSEKVAPAVANPGNTGE